MLNCKYSIAVKAEIVNGGIFLRPVGWHDKSQEYIWSDKWQEKIKQSKDDLENKNYEKFDNMDDLIKELGVEKMPILILNRSFKLDFKGLEVIEQKQAVKALRLLEANPKHPFLQVHRVNGASYWEIYVKKDIRIIFEQNSDKLILIAIGHHDILKKY